MKYFIFIFTGLLSFHLFSAPQERLEHLLEKGMDAFEKNICVEKKGLAQSGAITYFEDYISLGGDKDKVLKYLGYCKIVAGQMNENDSESLKDGVEYLSEVFEKNNTDMDLLKLIIMVYVKLEDFENAKTYALLLSENVQHDNELFLLVSRLYFNTKEYNKVVNYAKKYHVEKEGSAGSEYQDEIYFMIAYSDFQLKNDQEAKKYFNKLLLRKTIDKEMEKLSLQILEAIKQRENFGKYPRFFELSITNGLVLDTNINSEPSVTNAPTSIFTPKVDDIGFDLSSSVGVRDENFISLHLYPLNLNNHTIVVNFNNFIAVHYPKVVEEVFDPSVYDLINVSGILGYEFHHYFTQKNVLKFFVFGGYEATWTDAFRNASIYSKNTLIGLNIFYQFDNEVALGLYSNLNLENYDDDSGNIDNSHLNSETGKYFRSIAFTSLPITDFFDIQIYAGYLGSRSNGELFSYNGFLGIGELGFHLFQFMDLTARIRFEKKGYEYSERSDELVAVGGDINFHLNDYFSFYIQYHYYKNDSSLEEFSFNKHLLGLYFNFKM